MDDGPVPGLRVHGLGERGGVGRRHHAVAGLDEAFERAMAQTGSRFIEAAL
jgi:hypothetical protein